MAVTETFDEVKSHDLIRVCRAATERSPQPMLAVVGAMHFIRYANPAFCQLCKKPINELLGLRFASLFGEMASNDCLALLDRVFATGVAEVLADSDCIPMTKPNSHWSYMVWTISDQHDYSLGVMIQATDVSEAFDYQIKAVAVNRALLLKHIERHEIADALNMRLQRAMQETHHRVKNNLQIISALAEIQIDPASQTVPTAALVRIVMHVRTLAALHDILTRQAADDGRETLDTQITLNRLLPLLQASTGAHRIYSTIEAMPLTIQKSASLLLLVSELVSNAVKHGGGDITVLLTQEESRATLSIHDDGEGFPPNFDPAQAANVGLELVLSLAQHDLRGEIFFENHAKGGAQVTVLFPIAPELSYSS